MRQRYHICKRRRQWQLWAGMARAVRPLILRRTKDQVAPELPSRVEQTLVCELPEDKKDAPQGGGPGGGMGGMY